MKIRAKISEIETQKTKQTKIEQISETGSLFLEKINKINKSLARFIKKGLKIRNESKETTNTT